MMTVQMRNAHGLMENEPSNVKVGTSGFAVDAVWSAVATERSDEVMRGV